MHRVEENDGQVVVNVVILEGDVREDVLVRITTVPGSAAGKETAVTSECIQQLASRANPSSCVNGPIFYM